MSRLPFTISNQSLTFFVKGRPYSLTRDHASYPMARQLLQAEGDHDAEHLMALVDIRQALLRESQGRIVFDGDDVVFQGKALHNLWVDRILEFRQAGEDYSPLWNALDKLVHNPTPAAVERLPIFLDRSKLGFLPDGRFVAFKGVTSNYESAHVSPDGTRFRHLIGDKPRMPREACDADPNVTCSRGLHVGAPDYVRGHYSGGSFALVLCAVDPVDVVSVPTDYQGGKMRVAGYEVIDHLEQSYSDEVFGRLSSPVVRGYEPPVSDVEPDEHDDQGVEDEENENDGRIGDDDGTAEPYDSVKVGDVIEHTAYQGDSIFSLVIKIDDSEPDYRLIVNDVEADEISVGRDEFDRVVLFTEVTAAMIVVAGLGVQLTNHPVLRDGLYTIAGPDQENFGEVQDVPGDAFFLVYAKGEEGHEIPVENQHITAVFETAVEGSKQLFPLPLPEVADAGDGTVVLASTDGQDVQGEAEAIVEAAVDEEKPYQPLPGDLVQVVSQGWPPAGVYPVVAVYDTELTIQTQYDGILPVGFDLIGEITPRPWMRAEIGGTVDIKAVNLPGAAFRNGGQGIEVVDVQLWGTAQIQVRTPAGPWWVDAERVTAAYPKA